MSNDANITAKLFTSTLDNVLDAIKALIRTPYGCFEQTSSVTFPMVMGLQLLNEMIKNTNDQQTIIKIQAM